jgi:uncharacterized protein
MSLFSRLTILLVLFFAQANLILAAEFKKVCFPDVCIQAEVASLAKERERGLSNRKELPLDTGMLFVFIQEGRYSFWMKNMLFPLDIIWLDKDKKVIHIVENAPPCSESCPAYQPDSNALYCLETNAGFARVHNLKVGEQLNF